MYSIYNQSLDRSLTRECLNCDMPNFSTSLFDTIGLIETSNRFDSLLIPDSPIPTDLGAPTAHSSPVGVQHSRAKTDKTSVLNHPLRILIMNCQSIKNKKPELQTIVYTAKPDIILGCDSWLSPDIANSEIFPGGYDVIRKDRVGDAHGGVFVCFKKDLICTEVTELETECELVWVKLQIIGCKTLYLGSFYRPPDIYDPDNLDQLNSSLKRIMSCKNSHALLGGDFSCGDIDWNKLFVPLGMPKRQVQSQLIDIVQEHCLSQVVDIRTRQERILDILLTNNPTPVTRVKGMPATGRADHDIVLVEYDIKAKRIPQSPRKVFLYKRTDM